MEIKAKISKVFNALKNHIVIFWDWSDIALCFRIYRQSCFAKYYLGIDIQVLWLDIWIRCFERKNIINDY